MSAKKNIAAKTITPGDRINRPAISNWKVLNVAHLPSKTILDMGTTTLELDPEEIVSVSVFEETVADIEAMVLRDGNTLVSAEDIESGIGGRTYGFSAGAVVQVTRRNLSEHLASKHTVPVLWVSNATLASLARRA